MEDACVREIKEEVGVDVEDITYIASQPWPTPSSLMFGCEAISTNTEIKVNYTHNH